MSTEEEKCAICLGVSPLLIPAKTPLQFEFSDSKTPVALFAFWRAGFECGGEDQRVQPRVLVRRAV